MITWQDFEKIDVRVGTVIEVQDFPKAKRPAYQLTIDFGPLGIKKSSAQVTTHYDQDAIKGRQVLAVVNFPPKQIANFMSECLVLGVYDPDGNVVLIKPDHPIPNGCKLG